MPTKTKTSVKPLHRLARVSRQAGIVLMTAAVTVGMLDLPEHDKRVIVPTQPKLAFAEEENGDTNLNNPLRREREEAGPHYISYSVTQRTPGRTGKY